MENETQEQEIAQANQKSVLHQVTPLSKYLAMTLFIILPFLGGWIGYTYAPEKVVEVEREVIKEIPVESVEESSATNANQTNSEDQLYIGRDVTKSFVYLESNGTGKEYTIYEGDVSSDYGQLSPNERFLLFSFKPCGDRGCGSPGGPMIFDFSDESQHLIEFTNDDSIPYNDDPGSVAPMSQIIYGEMLGWDDDGRLSYEVNFEGNVYKYRSASVLEPWVLEYIGN